MTLLVLEVYFINVLAHGQDSLIFLHAIVVIIGIKGTAKYVKLEQIFVEVLHRTGRRRLRLLLPKLVNLLLSLAI